MNGKSSIILLLVVLFLGSLFVGGETNFVSVAKGDGDVFDVYYFYGQECPSCVRVEPFLDEIEQKYPLQIHKFEIFNNEEYLSLFNDYCTKYGVPSENRGVPTVFVSDAYFVGALQIFSGFEEGVKTALKEDPRFLSQEEAPAVSSPSTFTVIVTSSIQMFLRSFQAVGLPLLAIAFSYLALSFVKRKNLGGKLTGVSGRGLLLISLSLSTVFLVTVTGLWTGHAGIVSDEVSPVAEQQTDVSPVDRSPSLDISALNAEAEPDRRCSNSTCTTCGVDSGGDGSSKNSGVTYDSQGIVTLASQSSSVESFITDTGPELDFYQPCDGGDNLIVFSIEIFDINITEIKSATLTLRVWDVDIPGTSSCGPEIDNVFFNGAYLGYLTGANGQWSTCAFDVDPSLVVDGTNIVQIFIDTTGSGCWCVEVDWGELAVETGIDLKIESKDISLSTPSRRGEEITVTAKVHNVGGKEAKNVKVKFTDTFLGSKFGEETTIIPSIPSGGEAETSIKVIAWDLGKHKYTVVVDPDDDIEETDEGNNRAETHTISGTIKEAVSGTEPLKRVKIVYSEKEGGTWQTKYTDFTDDEGRYNIIVNLDAITEGKPGRVNATLEFSPDYKTTNTKIRVIHDSEWGAASAPAAAAKPLTKSVDVAASVEKDTDYPNKDISFNPQEGGSTYQAVTNAYIYFSGRTVNFEPAGRLDVEVADNDYHTSYYSPGTNTLHLHHTRLVAGQGYGKHSIAHEYAHRVSSGWNMPYGPGGPGDGTGENGLDENWANFGSCLARNDPDPHGSAGWVLNLNTNTILVTNDNYWAWSLADVWWELDSSAIDAPNKVVGTLMKYHPTTVEQFFVNYTNEYPTTNVTLVKRVFRLHGYNVTGWKGRGGVDPYVFTGEYNDYKVDVDGDGLADYLNINVGVDIATAGNYYVYGYLTSEGASGYCFALNYSYLDPGIQNVTLSFDGFCITQNKLNGTYSLVDLYWENEDGSLADYRTSAYNTSTSYDYREFQMADVFPTGTYADFGRDTDGDGLYNYLTIEVELNATAEGEYLIYWSLHDSLGNPIADAENYAALSVGVQSVNLNFDGVSVYANGVDGPYILSGLVIFDSDYYPIYSDPTPFNTSMYSYTDFQKPNASFTTPITDYGADTDGDGLYDYLMVDVSVNVTSPGDYSLVGYLYDNTGYYITPANNYTILDAGVQIVELEFYGESIYRNRVNGPYNLTLELYDSAGALIGRMAYTSSSYNYAQFQMIQEDYFNITFADYGRDTNGDTLFDYLTIEMNMSAIESGIYHLNGYLYDINGSLVAFAGNSSYVNDQTTVQINFAGKDLWKTKFINGMYILTLEIYNETYTDRIELNNVYTTQAYNYTQFQPSTAYFTDVYSDHGTDTDGDGLLDYLTVEVGVNVTQSGDYTLSGYLYDAEDNYIAEAHNTTFLASGSSVTLYFDGVTIYAHQVDGPYNLKYVNLYGAHGTELDYRMDAHTTQAYEYTQFEKFPVILTGNYTDYGSDTDTDGLYNFLTITAEVIVQNSGTYAVNARLMDQFGNEIIWAANTSYLSADEPQFLDLNFDGKYIFGTLVAGPYYMKDIHVYNVNNPTQSVRVHDAYTTGFYNYTQFEQAGIVEGYITDVNGTGIANSIVSGGGDIDVTKPDGSYKLIIATAGNKEITATPPYGTNFVANSTWIQVTLGEVTIANITLPVEGIITGIVTDDALSPVENAVVYWSGPSSGSNNTDANGRYMIRGLLAGTYTITTTPPSGTNLLRNETTVNVSAGLTTYLNITLPIGGILTGFVTDINGTAVYNAYIHVSGPSYSSDYTDENGKYEITKLETGNYSIITDPPYDANLLQNSTYAYITAGETTVLNITLPRGGIITGFVFVDGIPLEGIYIRVSGPTYATKYTNIDGNYTFTRLPTGNYTVTANPYGSYGLTTNSTSAWIVAGGAYVINFTLSTLKGVITGVVTIGGMPLEGVTVNANYSSDNTNSYGRYYILGLSNGTYNVTAQPYYYWNLTSISTLENITEGQTKTINFELETIGAMLTGLVTDVNGNPVANAYVSASGPSYGYDHTDINGRYFIFNLENGTHTISVSPSDNLLSNSTDVNTTTGTITTANIILPTGGTITGTVTDNLGSPVNNAYVYVSGPSQGNDHTDINGQYEIKRLQNGTYTVYFSPPSGTNLLSNSTVANVSLGEVTSVNMTLQQGGILTGIITADGAPVEDAYVTSSGPVYSNDYSNSSGMYELIRLKTGTYTVKVYLPPSYLLNASTTVNVTIGETVTLNFVFPIIAADTTKPIANAGANQTVNEDTIVTFNASASYDENDIASYNWTFTDAGILKTLSGVNPNYTFQTPGVYTVTLNITDPAGNWATAMVFVTVLDITEPVAHAGQDRTVNVGESVTFDASESTDNVGITSYEWDFGDGATGAGITTTHSYTNQGTYIVNLTVEDAAGNTASHSITVTAVTPTFPVWTMGAAAAAIAGILIIMILLLKKRSKV